MADLTERMKKMDIIKAMATLNRVATTKVIADDEVEDIAAAVAMAEITIKMLENLEPVKKLLCKKTDSFKGEFVYNLPKIDTEGKITGADKRHCEINVDTIEVPKVSYDSDQLKKDFGISVEEEADKTTIHWGKHTEIKEAFAEVTPTIKPKFMAGAISSGKLDKKYEVIKTAKSVAASLTIFDN